MRRSTSNWQQIIDDQTEPWGIKVSIVEVKDVELPQSMQRAMARQAEAEREKRAKIIHAEGEFQASQQLAQAAEVINQNPVTIQLRYLQTLTEIGAEKNTTVVFPLPIELIGGMLNGNGPSLERPGPNTPAGNRPDWASHRTPHRGRAPPKSLIRADRRTVARWAAEGRRQKERREVGATCSHLSSRHPYALSLPPAPYRSITASSTPDSSSVSASSVARSSPRWALSVATQPSAMAR